MLTTLIAATVLKPNLALHFDGNSVASIGDHPALRLTSEMTFEAWVFLEEPIVNRTFAYLLGKNYGGSGYEVTVVDRPHHRLHSADFANTNHGLKPSLPLEKWVHVAYARSLKRAKLYVDGELVLETPTGAPLTTNDLPVYIGSSPYADQEGKPCRFIGAMDEVQIWSVARSQRNIKTTMRQRPNVRNRALVVYLPFDEGEGQLLVNRTGRTGDMVLGDRVTVEPIDPTWVAGAPLKQ